MSHTIVQYDGALRCLSIHEDSGNVVVTDAPKDNHGLGEAFSPSELFAVSLGSCVLSMMGIVAQSMNLDITGTTATVEKQMADAPRRISSVAVTIDIPVAVTAEQARRLEAAAKACPVHALLKLEIAPPIRFRWANS